MEEQKGNAWAFPEIGARFPFLYRHAYPYMQMLCLLGGWQKARFNKGILISLGQGFRF